MDINEGYFDLVHLLLDCRCIAEFALGLARHAHHHIAGIHHRFDIYIYMREVIL